MLYKLVDDESNERIEKSELSDEKSAGKCGNQLKI